MAQDATTDPETDRLGRPIRRCAICGDETTAENGSPSEFVDLTYYLNRKPLAPSHELTDADVHLHEGWCCSIDHAREWLDRLEAALEAGTAPPETF